MKQFHSESAKAMKRFHIERAKTAAFVLSLLLLLFVGLFVSGAQAQVVENGDFESIAPNGLPASWHVGFSGEPDHETGGDVQVSLNNDAHRGKHSIQLRSEISSYPVFLDQDLLPSGE